MIVGATLLLLWLCAGVAMLHVTPSFTDPRSRGVDEATVGGGGDTGSSPRRCHSGDNGIVCRPSRQDGAVCIPRGREGSRCGSVLGDKGRRDRVVFWAGRAVPEGERWPGVLGGPQERDAGLSEERSQGCSSLEERCILTRTQEGVNGEASPAAGSQSTCVHAERGRCCAGICNPYSRHPTSLARANGQMRLTCGAKLGHASRTGERKLTRSLKTPSPVPCPWFPREP